MIPLEWTKLDSSHVRKVKYIPNVHDLRGDVLIEFNEGKIYRFKDVPQHKIERMVHSSSPGDVFHNHIKGQHDSEKVQDE